MSGDAPSLIPKPLGNDPEDVESALSAAEALWKRGEYHEAVRWVRKAANAAGEADADMRVIQLAKAAAELASMVDAFAPAAKTGEHAASPAQEKPSSPKTERANEIAPPPIDAPRESADSLELDVDVTTSIEPSPPPPPKPAVPKTASGETPVAVPMAMAREATGRRVPPPRPLKPFAPETSVVTSAPALDALKAGASSPPSSRAAGTTAFSPVLPGRASTADHVQQAHAPSTSATSTSSAAPMPNASPSPLRAITIPEIDTPIEEAEISPASVRAVDSRRPPPVEAKSSAMIENEPIAPEGASADDEDSMPRVPTVPPEPPDHHPTPLRMAVAPVAVVDAPAQRAPAMTTSQPAPRLATPAPLGRTVDVRAERRDALAIAPAIDVRPNAPAPQPAKPSTSQRLRTIVSSRPPAPEENTTKQAFPVIPAPRQKPASIPPPGRPLSARPPAPPDKPLELDLERSSLVRQVAEGQMTKGSTLDTHERLAAMPPSVSDTQQGLGPLSQSDGPKAPASPAVVVPPTAAAAKPHGLDLSRFEALADVPDDERDKIVAHGDIVSLLPDEEIDAPALVLVLHGEMEVRAKGRSSALEIVAADQLRILHPVAPADGKLVVVGGRKGARVLSLPSSAIEALRGAAPWVVQDLEPLSDDLHVVAGAIRGEIGRRLDDALLGAILARADTMRLPPGATVVKKGELVRALVVIGAGNLSLRTGDENDAAELATIDPGEVLFPSELLQRDKAPSTVRAGSNGAIVLVATRAATEELMMTYPPLLDILSQA